MTAPAPVHGGFDESEMYQVLKSACAAAGLDSSQARILRGHTNAVILLAEAPVVVKIARRGSRTDNVRRTVRFVRWLMDLGFPTAPLHPIEQPVVIGEHAVTFWTYLPQPEEPVPAVQLAKPLYTLHNLSIPAFDLPRHDSLHAIRRSISAITSLPPATCEFLSDRADRLERRLRGVEFALPEGVLHSDPQHRNALHAMGDDDALLCDWDTVAVGQPEWDLITVEVHCRRFGYGRAHYQAFADTYGFDVARWPDYTVLRDLRELRMITTNARKTAQTPGSLHEVERRVAGLRKEDSELQWRIL